MPRKMSHQKLLNESREIDDELGGGRQSHTEADKRLAKMGTTNLSSAPTTSKAMTMTETG